MGTFQVWTEADSTRSEARDPSVSAAQSSSESLQSGWEGPGGRARGLGAGSELATSHPLHLGVPSACTGPVPEGSWPC